MKEALISIIVPVYNSELYLKECIESLINQTYKNIEIILVDDKSEDNSLNILKEYECLDKRIKVISLDENSGAPSIPRNKGLDIAKGEYISFVDADDYIKLDAIEKMYNTAVLDDVDIVSVKFIKGPRSKKQDSGLNKIINSKEALLYLLKGRYISVNSTAKLFKSWIFKENRYENIIHEDTLFIYKLLLENDLSIKTIEDELYYLRLRDNSITAKKHTIKNIGHLKAYTDNFYLMQNKYPEYQKMMLDRILNLMSYLKLKAIDIKDMNKRKEYLEIINEYDKEYQIYFKETSLRTKLIYSSVKYIKSLWYIYIYIY